MKPIALARLVTLSALALAAAGAQANLLVNGSFEDGGFVDQGQATMSLAAGSTTISGWTVVTDTTAWIDIGNPYQLTASDGNRFLDLTDFPAGAPFAGMQQAVATLIGASYLLSFDLGSSNAYGRPAAITASAAGSSQTFTSALTGSNSDWETYSLAFIASSGSTVITLQGQTGNTYIGLDNAVLIQTAVPEPGSSALALLGLGALAGWLRRRCG
jgi:MYXO-CTERM domain-containing protein